MKPTSPNCLQRLVIAFNQKILKQKLIFILGNAQFNNSTTKPASYRKFIKKNKIIDLAPNKPDLNYQENFWKVSEYKNFKDG